MTKEMPPINTLKMEGLVEKHKLLISDNAVELCEVALSKVRLELDKNAEEIIIQELLKARDERVLLLKKHKGDQQIINSVARIDEIIKSQHKKNEQVKSMIINPESLLNQPKVEKLASNYDLTIPNLEILESYIEHLKQARELDSAGYQYLIKEENRNALKDVTDALEQTKEEREILLTMMLGNKDIKFQNSKNEDLNMSEIKISIEKIEKALHPQKTEVPGFQEGLGKSIGDTDTIINVPKNEEVQKIENEEKKELELAETLVKSPADVEIAQKIKNYRHKSITGEIRDLKNQLIENVNSEVVKKKIENFIAEYTEKIEYRVNEIKKESESSNIADLENAELKSAIKNLNGLKKLAEALTTVNSTGVKIGNFKKIKPITAPTLAQIESLIPNTFKQGAGLGDISVENSGKKESEEVEIHEEEANVENKPSEEEPYSSYDYLIRDIIANKDSKARIHFIHEHEALGKNLLQEIINKKNTEDDPLILDEYINKHQENIKSLINLVTAHGSEQGDVLLRILKEDLVGLNKHKSTFVTSKTDTEAEKNNENNADSTEIAETKNKEEVNSPDESETEFEPINLLTRLEGSDVAIMHSNPDLLSRTMEIVELYNNQIKIGSPKYVIAKSLENIEILRQEFHIYKKEFLRKLKKAGNEDINNIKPTKKEKLQKESFYNENEDYDVIERKINLDRRPLKTETVEPVLPKQEQPAQNLEPKVEEVPLEVEKSEPEIFTTEPGKDYGPIVEDKGFDTWLKNITESVKNARISIETETQDIDAWYQEYQESIPYKNKLNEISADIKKIEGVDDIKLLMTEKKINDLLYKIHREGATARKEIDVIFNAFEDSKNKEAEILRKKQSEELKLSIDSDRSRMGTHKELSSDQVKLVLESRGTENVEENIEEMVAFLKDIKNNYSFYSTKKEKQEFDDESFYNRYTATVNHNPNKKLGFFRKIISRFTASLPRDFDAVDFQNTTNLLKKVRELNLVDRKDGKIETVVINQNKMVKLIAFCKGQTGLLVEHVQNPASNKEEVLDNEQKEMLKLFDSMMKTFTESKYRGDEAREKAEEVLKTIGKESEEEAGTVETIKSAKEILFDDKEEIAAFEKEATQQVYVEALTSIDKELEKFSKNGSDIKELGEIEARYVEVKAVLKEIGIDETNHINIKIIDLKIDKLRLRRLNKDAYKDLSNNFPTYERITTSPDVKKEDKITYINELLTALETHKENKTNTMIQNAILNDTIEKYKKVLNSIK